MARGGSRKGKPGSAYANRTDMHQAPMTAPGQQYGKAQAQLQAQRAMPLPATPPPPQMMAQPPGGGVAGPMPAPMIPGQMPFDRPTEQPNVPVTAGLQTGPGPGPEALSGVVQPPDQISAQLHALYQMHPNDDLLRVLQLRAQGLR